MELFDRHNGDHLLYMINFFCTSVGAFSIKEGQKIENLIGLLPCEVKSEISVFNWLRGQYLLYGIKALRQILVRSYHEMIKRVGQNSSSFKK